MSERQFCRKIALLVEKRFAFKRDSRKTDTKSLATGHISVSCGL